METWTKTCGPIPGDLSLTHTQGFLVWAPELRIAGLGNAYGPTHETSACGRFLST